MDPGINCDSLATFLVDLGYIEDAQWKKKLFPPTRILLRHCRLRGWQQECPYQDGEDDGANGGGGHH